ncbi:MAG: glutathione transferase GstA [Bacteriovoracaceae bacterium]
MKFYYSTGACSLSPRIVACELGLKMEGIKVDLRKKTTEKGDDYLKICPKGQVPALQLDNGEVLTEGVAIIQYMASLVPGNKLMPEGFAKFRELEWLNFIATELHKTYGGFFNPHASDTDKNHLREKLTHKFAALESALTKGTYLMGNEFTLADAYLYNVLSWSGYVNVTLPKFLQDYTARVAQRPAVQEAMKLEGLTK